MIKMEKAPAEKPAFEIKAENGLRCPECGSERLYKDGLRYLSNGQNVQRYLCRDCGYRFSWPRAERRSPHEAKDLKGEQGLTVNECSSRALALLERSVEGAMSEVEESEKRAAGAITPNQLSQTSRDVKSVIFNFKWSLKKEGYSEATIEDYGYILEVLAKRGADIFNPESVKEVIAKQNSWSEARKWQAVKAYSAFAKLIGLTWTPPRYKPVQKLPFIPTEQEIDQLIAGCPLQMATFLQLLKETGVRYGEAFNLKWKDVDLVNKTVRITPEKSSNPRIFKISNKLAAMLSNLPMKTANVFTYKNKFYLRKAFLKQRKKIAFKLGNPRILQIHFHTFRHWKATMEYAKTKDILHVMQLLGHRNIKNTLIYTQLVNFEEDEYICRVAKTLEQAVQLVEAGFEYVTDMEGLKIFRKRK